MKTFLVCLALVVPAIVHAEPAGMLLLGVQLAPVVLAAPGPVILDEDTLHSGLAGVPRNWVKHAAVMDEQLSQDKVRLRALRAVRLQLADRWVGMTGTIAWGVVESCTLAGLKIAGGALKVAKTAYEKAQDGIKAYTLLCDTLRTEACTVLTLSGEQEGIAVSGVAIYDGNTRMVNAAFITNDGGQRCLVKISYRADADGSPEAMFKFSVTRLR